MKISLVKSVLVLLGLTISLPAHAASVTLQGSTPGTADVGNINVTGTIIGDVLQGTTLSVSGGASVGGTLSVNTIDPTTALTVGDTSNTLLLQGSSVNVKANAGGYTNTLTFASPSGSNKTITLPNATGTVCLDNNNCSFVNLGNSWPMTAQSGNINIGSGEFATTGNIYGGGGTFGGISSSVGVLTNKLTPLSTGSNVTVGATNSPLRLYGSSVWIDVVGDNGNASLRFDPGTGWNKVYVFPNGGGQVCTGSGNCGYSTFSLDNLQNVAINTTLLPATSGSADLGSVAKAFGKLYLSSDLQVGGNANVTGNTVVTGSLSVGGGTPITKHLSATSSQSAQTLAAAPACNSFTVTVTGAALGDTAVAAVDQSIPGTWTLNANVSAANTVTVKACAFDTSTSIAAGNYRVDVWKH